MIIEQIGTADSSSSTTTEEEVETESEQPTTTKKPTKARGRKSATSSSTTPTTTSATKAETGKIRKIVQIVTPANPTYTKGRCLQDESIEFRESKPLLGKCIYTVLYVHYSVLFFIVFITLKYALNMYIILAYTAITHLL